MYSMYFEPREERSCCRRCRKVQARSPQKRLLPALSGRMGTPRRLSARTPQGVSSFLRTGWIPATPEVRGRLPRHVARFLKLLWHSSVSGAKQDEPSAVGNHLRTLLVAVLAAKSLDLGRKWEHAFVYTALVFVVTTVALRPIWSRPFFWQALSIALLLHLMAISLITNMLPRDSGGIQGLPFIAMGIGECLLIANTLWRVTDRRPPG